MANENRRLGCFRLLDEVGRGSQRVVYKAVCERDGFEGVSVGAVVALRVLSVDSGDKDYEAQFEKRIAELKGLSHPSVAKCLGSFCEKGPFGDMRVLVQEWFEGESLKERLRRNPNGIDADEALRIGGQLLDALAYISSKGVVLGSVQPNHVVLCKDGSVKLAAFEYPVQQKPCMPTVCPPLNYTAPEFLTAEFRGDERSDIFSFGVCFHEMLTGLLPYAAQSHTPTIAEFFERWHGGDNAPIMIRPSVKRIMIGASEALEKALRGKREERYATFADFAAAFKDIHCRELTHGENTWRLVQYVGRGSFGEVFKARDVKTGQVVAIKRLCRSQYVDRFRREARILSRLNEPSIVRFVDFFEKELDVRTESFLVMQYLDGMPGRSLWDELKRAGGKPLPRYLVIRAFARYAHGLSVLHANGIVHRDIKPSNLYFPAETIDQAAIMDLAIARDMHGTMTAGAVPGTLDYMSPEVVISESRGDMGMDIYALGLSLYEALSGTSVYPCLPTGVEGFRELFERAKNKARPSLDESAYSDLPDLVRLVREMTEPDVARRLKDAAEVERRLRALLSSEGATVDPRVDDPEPQTIYAAPPYEELELEGDDARAINQIGELLKRQRRKQRLVQMCSYLLKGLVIMAALLVLSGAFVGLFWWGESCVHETLPRLKGSLAVRVLALFPWLVALIWSEMKTNRLPNLLTVGCLLSGIGVSAFEDGVTVLSAIGAVVVGAAVLLPFFLSRAVCAGTVKMFAAAMAFWGIRCSPFAFASLLCMVFPVCLVGNAWRRWFVKLEERHVPSSPIVLLSMLSLAVALWSWNGHGMWGGYIFMVATLALAAVARLLFRERKRHAEAVSTPSSTCAAETAPPHGDARTMTTTGSEPRGLLDETCRVSADPVSETEDGTDNPSVFLGLHVNGGQIDSGDDQY